MLILNHWAKRIGLVFAATALVFHLSVAHSVPIASDLIVTGNNTLDAGFLLNGTGTLDVITGGVSSSPAYPGTVSTSDALTDFNDGIGFTGAASSTDDEFAIGFDSVMSLTNSSTLNIFNVIIKFSYRNYINATGFDAFADSELTLGSNGGFDDIFFSDLITDTVNGNSVGGNSVAGFGGPLSENGDLFFNFLLNPSDVLNLELSWTLEGGDFDGGSAEAGLYAFMSIDSVDVTAVPTPIPTTFILVGLGLFLLPLQHRLRAYMR